MFSSEVVESSSDVACVKSIRRRLISNESIVLLI